MTYSGKYVELPSPEEVPNINLHVVNFHRPMLGTFHAKFSKPKFPSLARFSERESHVDSRRLVIVDRQIAITQSNNIQVRISGAASFSLLAQLNSLTGQ